MNSRDVPVRIVPNLFDGSFVSDKAAWRDLTSRIVGVKTVIHMQHPIRSVALGIASFWVDMPETDEGILPDEFLHLLRSLVTTRAPDGFLFSKFYGGEEDDFPVYPHGERGSVVLEHEIVDTVKVMRGNEGGEKVYHIYVPYNRTQYQVIYTAAEEWADKRLEAPTFAVGASASASHTLSCQVCEETASFECASCGVSKYCGQKCQSYAWDAGSHQGTCEARDSA